MTASPTQDTATAAEQGVADFCSQCGGSVKYDALCADCWLAKFEADIAGMRAASPEREDGDKDDGRAEARETNRQLAAARTSLLASVSCVGCVAQRADNDALVREVERLRVDNAALVSEVEKLAARLSPTIRTHDANPAQYWADRELRVDERGNRIPTLADCDWPKKHLRDTLADRDRLRAALRTALRLLDRHSKEFATWEEQDALRGIREAIAAP